MLSYQEKGIMNAPILALLLSCMWVQTSANCIADETINSFFEGEAGAPIPLEGSCCQADVCGLPCPAAQDDPHDGFGAAVIAFACLSVLIGFASYIVVHGQSVNFFVAGRTLPLYVVIMTLGSQSIDSNAILGNADLSYKYHFYDGAVIPIGLGLSLILNAVFFAGKINEEKLLTLPDLYGKRYGKTVEVIASLATIASFMCLLAGNLVGFGLILSYLFDLSDSAGIWIAGAFVWIYTVSGGLYSVAFTDVIQGGIGWIGIFVATMYFIANENEDAPPVSIGFPDYVYPDSFGEGGACDEFEGVPCKNDAALCCYNTDKWCPSDDNCVADNGAYPFGDKPIFSNQLTDPYALTPFPNAIFWDWATIFILAFGNLGALDFQARCMAARCPKTATVGCFIAGLSTFLIGVPVSYLGAIIRYYYGPDSMYAEFEADTCSEILGLPTCGMWMPDAQATVKYLTHEAPSFLGGWFLIGIVAASMSTADGAILAMGTVFSHNVIRNIGGTFVTKDNLLMVARISTIPFTLAAILIAAYYESSHSAGATGYLLIVAFDVVLATVVAPLFGCFYVKDPSPCAAFFAIIFGALTRIIMEFALPKDGFLLLPYGGPEFLDYGPAASSLYPVFFDKTTENLWDPSVEGCDQPRFEDYTGADSLAAFGVSVLTFVVIQFSGIGKDFGGSTFVPYTKDFEEEDESKNLATTDLGISQDPKAELKEEPKVDEAET